MPGRLIHDWPLIRDRYVTSDLSLRQVADERGISHRAIMARSKAEGWPQLRVEHVSAVASEAHQQTKAHQVREQVDTATAVRTILRGLISRFAKLVQAEAIDPTTHDFVEAARLALLLEGQLPADELRVMFGGKSPDEMTDAELSDAIVQMAEDIANGKDRDPAAITEG